MALNSYAQSSRSITKGRFVVDYSVKQIVDTKVTSLDGFTFSSMDFKIYDNDSLIADTYTMGKSVSECMTMATLQGDTINIIGFMGMFAGFGYQITLFKNSCVIKHFAKSDVEIYKLNKNDSLEFGLSVPCDSYKLILSQKPSYKKGEVIEGVIELTSQEYFEVSGGNEKKYKVQLTGYFRTEPLKGFED